MDPRPLVSMQFIADKALYKTEKPYFASLPSSQFPEGYKTNLEFENVGGIPVTDLREQSRESIDVMGFSHVVHDFQAEARGNEETCKPFLAEASDLVRTMFEAERTICYDYRLRKNVPSNYAAGIDFEDDHSIPAPPVTTVHMDHTKAGGYHRIKRHLTAEESQKYLSGRYRVRIINVWKPLAVIRDSPLALCDPRSVSKDDLLEADRVSPFYAGEIYYLKYNPDQTWYWLSEQQPNEVTLFVTFDSQLNETGIMNTCAHAAFADPNFSADVMPRESVEVRIIVFNRV
ncbi:hypothetical protein BKA64DRAFT_54138 [Cadophora sp. MPI-SDFR-AT-0126]|nr:hypothetical protein BKA64DRAFT_54138 [Leotiomycetes sp. MPI-SDFR-AT-0126]